MRVQSLGREVPLEEEMATHSSILAWKISWTEKPRWAAVFFPEKFNGQRSLVGYSPWNCKELDITEHTHTHTHIDTHIYIISTHMCVYIVAVVVRVYMQLNVPLLLPVYLSLKS